MNTQRDIDQEQADAYVQINGAPPSRDELAVMRLEQMITNHLKPYRVAYEKNGPDLYYIGHDGSIDGRSIVTLTELAAWAFEFFPSVPDDRAAKTLLLNLSRLAHELIKVIELEKSGVRDGDGFWHGSDALEGSVLKLSDCWQQYKRSLTDDEVLDREIPI